MSKKRFCVSWEARSEKMFNENILGKDLPEFPSKWTKAVDGIVNVESRGISFVMSETYLFTKWESTEYAGRQTRK